MSGYRFIIKSALLWAVIAAMLTGCGEKPAPAPQADAVRTKIASPKKQPEKQDMAVKQPAAVAAKSASVTARPLKTEKQEEPSDLIQASLAIASTYDAKGRFDPFEPLFKEEPDVEPKVIDSAKRKKRVPQTPLERVALSQLKLSAIIRAPSGNRALVEDATGKGYVVKNGTYMGLNSGKVIEIERDRIIVEEEVENVLGELTIKNTELKLQKPAGEL